MSFREKTAWISMLSMAGIYGFYFWSVMKAGPQQGDLHFGGLLETIIALVVVQVLLTIAVAVFNPKDAQAPRDEREKLIELKSTRIAYAGLASGIALACFFAAFNPPILFNANALLFILVTAEIMRSACQVIQHRRAA
ncbi:MAG TPA: hypothetical protein VGO25_13840 [Rhodanobacteraceae bacterium]|jgi:hypothetical protein|nr:hypothetical protein [Rhodanobacteraceae bacterium]